MEGSSLRPTVGNEVGTRQPQKSAGRRSLRRKHFLARASSRCGNQHGRVREDEMQEAAVHSKHAETLMQLGGRWHDGASGIHLIAAKTVKPTIRTCPTVPPTKQPERGHPYY
jgi:hypothetical protein